MLKLILRYLEAGLMKGGMPSARREETPQREPLSPLLSNILLTDLIGDSAHRFGPLVFRPEMSTSIGSRWSNHLLPIAVVDVMVIEIHRATMYKTSMHEHE